MDEQTRNYGKWFVPGKRLFYKLLAFERDYSTNFALCKRLLSYYSSFSIQQSTQRCWARTWDYQIVEVFFRCTVFNLTVGLSSLWHLFSLLRMCSLWQLHSLWQMHSLWHKQTHPVHSLWQMHSHLPSWERVKLKKVISKLYNCKYKK